jgi:hypothetical protein
VKIASYESIEDDYISLLNNNEHSGFAYPERTNGDWNMKRILVVGLMFLLCLSMFSILAPSIVRVSASSPPGKVDNFSLYSSGSYELLIWGNPLISGFPDTSVTAFKIYKDGSLLATVNWTICRYRDYNPVSRWCTYGISAVNAAGEGPQYTESNWWSSIPSNVYYDLKVYCSPPEGGKISGMFNLRSGQITAGNTGLVPMVNAWEAPGYNFTSNWTKTGSISITFYAGQRTCYINSWWENDATITAYFQQLPAHDVTISAHCNTEGVNVIVAITKDGSSSGYSTPHTFTGLTDTHTFTVLDRDYDNHPFAYWDSAGSGQTSTTISVSNAGTHTAYYQALPYKPQGVAAIPVNLGIDLTWSPPTPPAGYTVQSYNIYRGTTPDFAIPWSLPYHTVYATTHFQDSILDNNIYYYRVVAHFQQGLGAPSDPAVGCARLESVKGIESTITGVTSLSVPLLHFFSLQQNFYLFTGNKDAQGNPVVYWCQNCVDEMQNWNPIGCCYAIMFIFNYNWLTGQHSLYRGSLPIPLLSKDVPDTLYFKAEITSGSLSMTNSIGSWSWSSEKLGLTSDAFISTIVNPYGSARAIDSPNLDVVAGGILFTPTPTDVTFNSGQGYVSCEAEIGGKWIPALNERLVTDSSSDATGETSTGLQWNNLINSAYYYYQDGARDYKGVMFVPNFNAPVTQEILFNILGKIVKTLVFSAACPVYLDLYDDQERCVGYNSTSGTVEFQIDNVVWESNQTLLVFDPSGTYRVSVTGTENGTFTSETLWQDVTGATSIIANFTSTIMENETQVYTVGADPNVALINVLPSKTVVCQGFGLQVNATVADLSGGNATFDVTLYANGTIIGTQNALNVSGWDSATACFTWNTTGFARGNYTISAVADTVPGETDFGDNTLIDGEVMISKLGDLNLDGAVNYKDASLFRQAYIGEYSYLADFNQDEVINYKDASLFRGYYVTG